MSDTETKVDPILARQKILEAARLQEEGMLKTAVSNASVKTIRDITATEQIATTLVAAMISNATGGGKVLGSTQNMEAAATLAVQLARMIVVQAYLLPGDFNNANS